MIIIIKTVNIILLLENGTSLEEDLKEGKKEDEDEVPEATAPKVVKYKEDTPTSSLFTAMKQAFTPNIPTENMRRLKRLKMHSKIVDHADNSGDPEDVGASISKIKDLETEDDTDFMINPDKKDSTGESKQNNTSKEGNDSNNATSVEITSSG